MTAPTTQHADAITGISRYGFVFDEVCQIGHQRTVPTRSSPQHPPSMPTSFSISPSDKPCFELHSLASVALRTKAIEHCGYEKQRQLDLPIQLKFVIEYPASHAAKHHACGPTSVQDVEVVSSVLWKQRCNQRGSQLLRVCRWQLRR